MKLFLASLLVSLLLISGCTLEPIDDSGMFKDYSLPSFDEIFKEDTGRTPSTTVAEKYNFTQKVSSDDYLIGSFNIQVFGKKKANSNVMPVIEEIINDYDILAIQEIRDLSGDVIGELNDIRGFDMRVGPRLGRSSSKEQYIFFYSDRVVPGRSITYPDSEDDFEREPFAMSFMVDKQEMIFIQVHIKPDDAEEEIKKLPDVVDWAKKELGREKYVYIMGDLNAGGVYFDSFDFLEENWNVLIDESLDTNVAIDGCCAYDRILATNVDSKIIYVGVDDLMEETGGDLELIKAISDHYPIQMIFEKTGVFE